jgi:hypothetical protein
MMMRPPTKSSQGSAFSMRAVSPSNQAATASAQTIIVCATVAATAKRIAWAAVP